MRIDIPALQDYENRIECNLCHCTFTYNINEDVRWKEITQQGYKIQVVSCPGCGKNHLASTEIRSIKNEEETKNSHRKRT